MAIGACGPPTAKSLHLFEVAFLFLLKIKIHIFNLN